MQWLINICTAAAKAYTDQAILDAKVIPSGTIIGWWGIWADCPAGWVICDGHAEGPDLRAKFMRSSGSGVDVMSFGGSNTHTHPEGIGLRTGIARDPSADNVPEYVAMWWIMKL